MESLVGWVQVFVHLIYQENKNRKKRVGIILTVEDWICGMNERWTFVVVKCWFSVELNHVGFVCFIEIL